MNTRTTLYNIKSHYFVSKFNESPQKRMAEPKNKLFAVKFIWALQASKVEFKPSNDDYSAYALFLLSIGKYIYIYIYRERERETAWNAN